MAFLGLNQFCLVGLRFVVVLKLELPKAHRKWFYGKARNRTCDPWFTRHSTYPLHHRGWGKNFLLAFLGLNQFCWVGLRYVCWFHDGNTQRLTKSGFMEKPGIEPATPGLQGIALIPYTFFVAFLGINQFCRVSLRFVFVL